MFDTHTAGHASRPEQPNEIPARPPRPWRSLTTAIGFVLLVVALWWGTVPPVSAAWAGVASFDQLVAAAAAVVAWALTAWILLVVVITALAAIPGWIGSVALRCAQRMAPAAARNLARTAIGMATLGLPYAPVATASATSAAPPSTFRVEAVSCQDPGATDDELPGVGRPPVMRPVVHQPETEEPGIPQLNEPPRPPDRPAAVTVEHGDTLWGIAARHLGPDVTDAVVARESARWYAANRDVIGADPDLIHPGMRLRPPAT